MAHNQATSELQCVREPDLRAFVLGELPERVDRLIADHLSICPACEAKVRLFDKDTDPVIRGIRRTHGTENSATRVPDHTPTNEPITAIAPATAPPGYEFSREIGRGGMGVVYLARQRHPQRLVAIKVLLAGAHSGAAGRARFLAEADAIARLQHPNIVQIYEVGEHAGLPFFALEYVERGSLADVLNDRPQPTREASELVRTLARAVQFAHQRGVIHRDLKPANVLMQIDSDTSTISNLQSAIPKIADFGLAKHTGPELTTTGELIGTPQYMAPEQATGGKIGPGADVWALGAILYECLTGHPPFCGSTQLETLEQVRNQDAVPPRRLQPRLPHDLETICLKCLRKEPERRYSSAAALADDLDCFLAGKPIRARPVSIWERSLKWARRRPAIAALVSTLAIAVLCIVVLIAVDTARLRSALQLANERGQQLEIANQRAERDLKAARAAVNDFLGATIESGGIESGRDEKNRQKMLESALIFYQGFLQDNPTDPAVRYETAQAYYNVGRLRANAWQYSHAQAAYGHAVALLEDLVKDYPDNRKYRCTLSGYSGFLGHSLRSNGKAELALVAYRRGIELEEAMLRETPDDIDEKLQLANHLINLSVALANLDRLGESEEDRLRAVELQRAAFAARPEAANCRAELSLGLADLGRLRMTQKNWHLAEPLIQEAIKLWAGLATEFPNEPMHKNALADGYNLLGEISRKLGKTAEAIAAYDAAAEVAGDLVRAFPDAPNYRKHLAFAQSKAGHMAVERLDYPETVRRFRIALENYRKLAAAFPKDAAWKLEVTLHCNNLAWQYSTLPSQPFHDPAAATILIEEARQLMPRSIQLWNTLAAVHLSAGRWTEAITAADKSISYKGESDYDLIIKTIALAHLNKSEDAQAILQKAKQLKAKSKTRDPVLDAYFSEATKLLE